MSDLSHESREVLRLHTEALNNFTALITDIAFKIEYTDFLHSPVYEFKDAVVRLEDAITDAITDLKELKE